jgi:hypothetical protein
LSLEVSDWLICVTIRPMTTSKPFCDKLRVTLHPSFSTRLSITSLVRRPSTSQYYVVSHDGIKTHIAAPLLNVSLSTGCPADSSIGREIIDFLILSLEIIGSITLAQGAFVEDTSILCDGAGIAQAEIDIVSQRLSTQVCKTTINLVDFRDLMSCDNWYPLYEESMYNSLCYDATDGFAWVTTTQIAIVFLSLLIVTSRSVYYEIETEDATAVHNKLNYKNDNEATENNDLQLQENHENEITTPEIELQESPQPQEESNVKAEDS